MAKVRRAETLEAYEVLPDRGLQAYPSEFRSAAMVADWGDWLVMEAPGRVTIHGPVAFHMLFEVADE